MKKQRTPPPNKEYREPLDDEQYAITMLAVAAGVFIMFTLSIILWLI